MLAGIRDVAIITTPQDEANLKNLLDDGDTLGLRIEYIVQDEPAGIS